MKLVDILARELAEWPVKEGVYPPGQDYCVQSDECSQVFFCGTHGKILLSRRADKTSGVRVTRAEWQAAVDALKAEQAAELKWPDGATHFTPRQSSNSNAVFWRVENGKAVMGWPYFGGEFHSPSTDIPEDRVWQYPDTIPRPTERAVEWDGVGGPAPGSSIEYSIGDGWYPCEVRYVLNRDDCPGIALVAWCEHLGKDQYLSNDRDHKFRPIRTAEQVAAEEREKAIKDMMEVTSDGISCIGQDDALALYKAGYRKEKKPCGF